MESAEDIVRHLSTASPAARRVIRRIVTSPEPVGRTTLSLDTNLSLAAITKAVGPLVDAGLFAEAHDDSGDSRAPGRPVLPLAVRPGAILVIGLKLTRTALYAVVTDLSGHRIAEDVRALADNDVDRVVSSIVECVEFLKGRVDDPARIVAVGVSVSGEVDLVNGFVRESPLLGWKNVPLRNLLDSKLRLPVAVDNDVHALIFHEHWYGEGRDVTSLAIVTIGAGIGSGILLQGIVIEGAHGIAGELGHLPLAAPERQCHCGRFGCVEAVAGFDGIVETRFGRTGEPLVFEEVAGLAHAGEAAAVEAFTIAGVAIGAAIASLVNLVGPDLVYITGEGVSELELYQAGIDEAFSAHAFGGAVSTPLIIRPHGFDYWAVAASTTAIRAVLDGDLTASL